MHTSTGGMQVEISRAQIISARVLHASCYKEKRLARWFNPLVLIDII